MALWSNGFIALKTGFIKSVDRFELLLLEQVPKSWFISYTNQCNSGYAI